MLQRNLIVRQFDAFASHSSHIHKSYLINHRMELGIIAKNLVIAGGILGLAFASQQPWLSQNSKSYAYAAQGVLYSQGAVNKNDLLKTVGNWIGTNVYSKVSGGVAQGNAAIGAAQNDVASAQQNILQNSVDSTKDFIAQQVLNALGVKPQDLGASCKAN
jgi:hypothetical protein